MDKYEFCYFSGAYAKIYTLADENGNVFYVGCTTMRLEERLANHISIAKNKTSNSNKRKTEIIRKLNYKIIATIVDMVWVTGRYKKELVHKAANLEKKWIAKYASLGYDLCNGRKIQSKKIKELQPEFIGKAYMVESSNKDLDKPKITVQILEKEPATAK